MTERTWHRFILSIFIPTWWTERTGWDIGLWGQSDGPNILNSKLTIQNSRFVSKKFPAFLHSTVHTQKCTLACLSLPRVLLLFIPPAAIHLIGLWKTLISLLVVVFVLTPLHSLPAKNWSASQSNLETSDQQSEPCKHHSEPLRPGQRATRKTCCNQKGPSGWFPQWGSW